MRAVLLALGVVAAACGGGGGGAKQEAEEPRPAVLSNEPAPEEARSVAPEAIPAAAGVIGVPACDEYIARFDTCAEMLARTQPEGAEAMRVARQTLIDGWRQAAASSAAARDAMQTGCAMALAQARESYEALCPGVW